MNVNYAKYLLMMIVIVPGAAVIFAMLRFRMKRRSTRPDVSCKPVEAGNISIFFDKQGNATIIPYVADLFGDGKATTDIMILHQPYKPANLGAAIRNSLASCRSSKPTGSAQLMEKLQFRGWKEFSEGKKNLSIYYKDGAGIVFNTTVRTSVGAYIFNSRGMEHFLPADATNEVIGSTSIELLKRCRS